MRRVLFTGMACLAASCASTPRARIDPPHLPDIRAVRAELASAPASTSPRAAPVAATLARSPLAVSAAPPAAAPTDDAIPPAYGPTPLRQDDRPEGSYTALTLGAFEPAGDFSSVDTGFWGDLAFGRRFARLFVVEGSVGYFDASSSLVDVYGVPLLVEGRVGFPVLIVEPYVGVGGGGVWVHSNVGGVGVEDDFAGLLDAFIGLDVGFEKLGVGAEYKYVYSGDVDVPGGGSANLEGSVFTLMGRLSF